MGNNASIGCGSGDISTETFADVRPRGDKSPLRIDIRPTAIDVRPMP